MNRRRWLQAGCGHCAAWASWSHAQQTPAWAPPVRFSRPDLSTDEGGLWAMMDRQETRLRRSPFLMRQDVLGNYLNSVACKLAGAHCPDMRVYPIRAPFFNASMAPNGMMQVWTGLLLRVENEAQLAAVLGHEVGHFMERHTLEQLRDIRSRSSFGLFLAMFGLVGLIAQMANMAGAMAFSRDHERDADRIGVQLMRASGHDPREAAKVWAYLLDELKATPDNDPTKNSVLFATHPPSEERMLTLREMTKSDSGQTYETEFQAILKPFRFEMLEDELKRSKPYETVVLLNRLLAREADSAELLFFRGEAYRLRAVEGDLELALKDYLNAVKLGSEPATTHRALGELYKRRQQVPEAKGAWQRYLELAPQAPDAELIKQQLEELKS